MDNHTFVYCIYKRDRFSLRPLDERPKYFITKSKAMEYWKEMGDKDYGYMRFRLEDWTDLKDENK